MKKIDIIQAKELLLAGGVVAIPTETVYGLAGWIHSEEGLRKIFATKERPFFDPLIIHVDSIHKAKELTTEWTEIHEVLAQHCWPGPLTIIAKKNGLVNPLITAGLDSVALRSPDHPLTLKLLSMIDGGVAAPSANKFGKTSPTQALHVYQEFGDEVSIVDGGQCEVGIESTVAGIDKDKQGYKVLIYRPGHYTPEMIQKILSDNEIVARVEYAISPVAPGQLKHHYMPKIPIVITDSHFNWETHKNLVEKKLNQHFSNPAFWSLATDPRLASRELYQDMRNFSDRGHDIILLKRDDSHNSSQWQGIWNRLDKAKTLEIKLEKGPAS